MRIVDCHVHVEGEVKASEVLARMDANGVARILAFSECERTSLEKTRTNLEKTRDLCAAAPDRIGGLAWVNPVLPGMADLAEEALADMGYCGLKIIPDHYFVHDARLDPFWERMNKIQARILFHTGILYAFEDSSQYCRPVYLEKLLHYPNIRFAMAHISWPWCEECLAVMGRMRSGAGYDPRRWRSYVDMTPGTPRHIRKQAVANAIDFCGVERLLFGSDACLPGDLSTQAKVLKGDLAIFDELGLTGPQKERILAGTADELFPGKTMKSRQPSLFPEPDAPAPEPSPLRIGTSGFSYANWAGSFYPEGTTASRMFAYYAKQFNAVELNFTYYALPKARAMEKLADHAPPGFDFFVKTHKTLTHERTLDDTRAYLDGISPLRESGALGGLLAQFPQSFKNTAQNRKYLQQVADAFRGLPLAVEFRDNSWNDEEVFTLLEECGLHFVAVDEPQTSTLMPIVARTTAGLGYVRFHSRNAANWFAGGGARYDYLFSDDELREWLPRIQSMMKTAKRLYIYFNNCHRGSAAQNALRLKELVKLIA